MKINGIESKANHLRIGIISLYGWLKLWDNYGTLLQNFALQEYLKQQGHSPYWIRTRVDKTNKPIIQSIKEKIIGSLRFIASPIKGHTQARKIRSFNKKHPRNFHFFIEKHVSTSSIEYTENELLRSPPESDVLIVGSDQIWTDVTKTNFLAFGDSAQSRIAYAVSAPWQNLQKPWYEEAAKYVNNINSISVREVSGLNILEKLGRIDVEHVVDPVLLHNKDFYLNLIDQESTYRWQCKEKSVLAYYVNLKSLDDIPWESSLQLSEHLGCKLNAIPMQGAELVLPETHISTPSPIAWIEAFNQAEFVLTNSYHGALFSIIMKKSFLIFLQDGHGTHQNIRFTSALAPLGLHKRILSSNEWRRMSAHEMQQALQDPINWKDVDDKLHLWREKSKAFLINSLN